jgi:hypothetical protein
LLFSLLHSPVTSSLLGPNILLSTLFSKTLSLHTGKFKVFHFLNYAPPQEDT